MVIKKLTNRAINYAVTPLLSKLFDFLEDSWNGISPENRQRILRYATLAALPLFYIIDGLRAGLVRAYVINPKFSEAVMKHSLSVTRIAFRKPVAEDAEPGKLRLQYGLHANSDTRPAMFPVVIAALPFFYVVDMFRSWVADTVHPEYKRPMGQHLEAIWQYTFGGTYNS